jgi:nicotinic acid mononucleotide adenylyltransferase
MEALKRRHPDTNFVWIMGADNLERFPEWIKGDDIFKEFSVAIISRPGYDDMALQSPTLRKFESLRFREAADFDAARPGWIFISDPGISDAAQSSSALLKRLRAGETRFEGHFGEIAAYIRRHGLYGTSPAAPRPPAP